MKNIQISKLFQSADYLEKTITVQGFVRTRRDSKAGISFVHLSDGSTNSPLQLVISKQLPNYQSEVLQLTTGCAIRAQGKLVKSIGHEQSIELHAEDIEVVGWVEDPNTYPMAAKHHTLEHLREHAHLRARSQVISATMRLRHAISKAIHDYLHEKGFFWIHTPILTASDCEGAGELFRVSTLDFANLPKKPDGSIDFSQDFFGRPAFLTVSGQLNVEAYCLAMSRVYTFGPTFRAENSNTTRHLAEFWMIEPEIAFANLDDDAALAEGMLKSVCQYLLNHCDDDIRYFTERVDNRIPQRLDQLASQTFAHMEYQDAIQQLDRADKLFVFPVRPGMDLQTEHERYLSEELVKGPVVVRNYPKQIKSFYMRLNDDGKTVAAMDVLVPGMGEIIGGSQREERLDVLDQRIIECGLNPEDYQWYRDLRRYGTVPHAGFGLGLERLLSYVTGLHNVRDVIPFPRAPKLIGF